MQKIGSLLLRGERSEWCSTRNSGRRRPARLSGLYAAVAALLRRHQAGRPASACASARHATRGVRPRGRGQREESGHQGTGRVLSMAAEISLLFLPLHPFCLRPACTCTPCRPSPGFHWLTAPSHSLRPLGSRHGTVLSYASAVSP